MSENIIGGETEGPEDAAGALDTSYFALDDSHDHNTRRIEILLRRAVLDKYRDAKGLGEAIIHEIISDAQAFLSLPGSAGSAAAAAYIIGVMEYQRQSKRRDFKDVLSVWYRLQKDRESRMPQEQAYARAEERMHRFGIIFEGLPDVDIEGFDYDFFRNMGRRYNLSVRQRVARAGRNLREPSTYNLSQIAKGLGKGGAFLGGFTVQICKDLLNNVPELPKSTAATLRGVRDAFAFAGERIFGARPLPRQHRAEFRRQLSVYNARPDLDSAHWQEANIIRSDMKRRLVEAFLMGSSLTANASFSACQTYDCIDNLAQGRVPAAIFNAVSIVIASRPMARLADEFMELTRGMRSARAREAEIFVHIHEDIEEMLETGVTFEDLIARANAPDFETAPA